MMNNLANKTNIVELVTNQIMTVKLTQDTVSPFNMHVNVGKDSRDKYYSVNL